MIYHGIMKPLYLQIRDILVEQIETEQLLPGDVLPGERVLAEMYDVSRVTIRKSIGIMVEEGYLIRTRGKGTTVASRKVNHRLGALMGVAEELSEFNNTVEIQVLNKGYGQASPDVRKYLNLPKNSEMYEFSRLILKDNKPLILNRSYVSYDIGRLVENLDLKSDKVFKHLENCGYKVSYAEQVITAGVCTEEEAELLKYKVGSPALIMKRTTFLESGYPILYEKSIYRGDAYQYSIKLLRK